MFSVRIKMLGTCSSTRFSLNSLIISHNFFQTVRSYHRSSSILQRVSCSHHALKWFWTISRQEREILLLTKEHKDAESFPRNLSILKLITKAKWSSKPMTTREIEYEQCSNLSMPVSHIFSRSYWTKIQGQKSRTCYIMF